MEKIINQILNIIKKRMENGREQKNEIELKKKHPKIIVLFQEEQTVGVLEYLTLKDNRVIFQSQVKSTLTQNIKKKSREFVCDKIYFNQSKMRIQFSSEINSIISSAVNGIDQSIFIYGTEEPEKHKLIYGEPRDPGLILLLIESIFAYCHKNHLEHKVTVKMSFCSYERGQFKDLLVNSKTNLKICHDPIQKEYLLGQSEIIVRNLKTAIKIAKVAMSNGLSNRQDEDVNSQCVIFQLKIEVELPKSQNSTDQQEQHFQISKVKVIKFGDPTLNKNYQKNCQTLKINEHNRWAINLDNCLRERSMLQNGKSKNYFNKEDLTQYMRSIIMGESEIICYLSITNKMSANDCLNCFLFSYYVSKIEIVSRKSILHISKMVRDMRKWEEENKSLIEQAKKWNGRGLIKIEQNINKIMNLNHILQCEYSNLLSLSCNTLSKYVMNEDIESFYYCRKEVIKGNEEIDKLLSSLKKYQEEILELQKTLDEQPYMKKLGSGKSTEIAKVIELYKCAALHYFYEQSIMFKAKREDTTITESSHENTEENQLSKEQETLKEDCTILQAIMSKYKNSKSLLGKTTSEGAIFRGTKKIKKTRKEVDYIYANFTNQSMQSY